MVLYTAPHISTLLMWVMVCLLKCPDSKQKYNTTKMCTHSLGLQICRHCSVFINFAEMLHVYTVKSELICLDWQRPLSCSFNEIYSWLCSPWTVCVCWLDSFHDKTWSKFSLILGFFMFICLQDITSVNLVPHHMWSVTFNGVGCVCAHWL